MKELQFKVTGVVPLLMHSNRAANPLDAYANFMKPLQKKRNKTDQDYIEISRVEWEAGLYLHDGIVALPAENLDRCLWDASKKTKSGKLYKSGALISEDWIPMDYRGPKIKIKQNGKIPLSELDGFYNHFSHRQMVKVSGQQVLRTRPIFHDWSFTFNIMIDEQVLDERTMERIAETAGRYIGLGEKRPRLGRFEVELI
jgi:hypothetical protein